MTASRPVRTRMAPSPTGFMHVGNLRTVLYDYFLARQSEGGKFVVRIEDTDQERLVPDALERLLKTLDTIGIDYDEGPVLNTDGTISEKGPYGPYIQSKRLDTYKPIIHQLLAAGHAYYCFCSSEELDEMRRLQTETKQAFKYDRRCLKLAPEEIERRLADPKYQAQMTVRMKVPETGTLSFEDGIRGRISFEAKDVDDQIILKSDGFPTYHLAVVVDDHLMEITHVLRGEEWISSTPKQILLHQMLGWEMPVYAHVPLLLNPDKTKLSKRKGDVSVESYLAKGYLPEALINFLALLGWNPTGDRELFTREELVRLFDLSKVNRSGAVMNIEKLNWTNNQYLRELPEDTYLSLCLQPTWLPEAFLTPERRTVVERALLVIRERLEKFSDLATLLTDVQLFDAVIDYSSVTLVWKKSTKEATRDYLKELRAQIKSKEEEWFNQRAEIEVAIRALITERGWSNGDVLWPLRVALSGKEKSPSPFDYLWMLGKDESLSRIDAALASLA